jgi:thiosulfate dehydrogenase
MGAKLDMKKFIIGLVVGLVVVPLMAFLYFAGGFAPVATSDPMMPMERFMASTALHARLSKDMPKSVPVQANDDTYLAGAMIYMHNCAVCHGLLNRPESAISKGMFPHPPQLLPPGHGVTDDPPGETYWKVKNGIRLTGMPGFHGSLTEEEMWQVSVMLANADKLPDSIKSDLTFGPAPAAPSAPEKK